MNLSRTNDRICFEYCVANRLLANAELEAERYKGTPSLILYNMHESDRIAATRMREVLDHIIQTLTPGVLAYIIKEGKEAYEDQRTTTQRHIARQQENEQRHAAAMLAS